MIVVGCCLGVVFGLAAFGYAASPHDPGLQAFGWVMLAIFIWVFGVRNLRAGVYPKERGILVRNHFRTYEVPWEEIDEFVLAPHGLTPAMGHVVLRSGNKRAISSISASSFEILAPKLHPTSNLLDELNDLATRMNRAQGESNPSASATRQ